MIQFPAKSRTHWRQELLPRTGSRYRDIEEPAHGLLLVNTQPFAPRPRNIRSPSVPPSPPRQGIALAKLLSVYVVLESAWRERTFFSPQLLFLALVVSWYLGISWYCPSRSPRDVLEAVSLRAHYASSAAMPLLRIILSSRRTWDAEIVENVILWQLSEYYSNSTWEAVDV
jgi:hypothetical protein